MTEQRDRLKTALADRYAIEHELGSGGMATVYLAQDLKHERQVALKVLRPELAAALGPERFTREIKIAARLQHPHILPLHDSGEAAGFLYYVMPYVKGDSLRDRLTAGGELPIDDAVRIIRDMVDALAHAHEHGVVHRDLKPDNVMLSKRHALVMDFGVAKAVSEATGRHQLTTAGVALGTPAYMAPEQASADPQTDHRADIYAVGIVAYELLTGSPPFAGPNSQAVLSAQVLQDPEPVAARRASVPGPLADLVMRCLEKQAADRWQSADEMLAVLDGLTSTSGGITPTQTRPVSAVHARNRNLGLLAAALVGAGVVAAAGFLLRSSPETTAPASIDRQVTFHGNVSGWAALARDERTIAYWADGGRSLMVQDLAGGGSSTLAQIDGAVNPFSGPIWGADGSRVFFVQNTETSAVLVSVPRLGGPLRAELDLTALGPWVMFRGFTPSGEYVFGVRSWLYVGNAPETMSWVSEDSLAGDGTLINLGPTDFAVFATPSPDGRWLVYLPIVVEGESLIGLVASDGTRRTTLIETTSVPWPLGWTPESDAVYYAVAGAGGGFDVFKLPIDPVDGTRAGEPTLLLQRVLSSGDGRLVPFMRVAGRTLLYSGGASSSNLKVIDLSGAPSATDHPTSMLTGGTATNTHPALSPDGDTVVFTREIGEERDFFLRPTRGEAGRLLMQLANPMVWTLPVISRDARRLAYYEQSEQEGSTLIVVDLSTGRRTEYLALGDGFGLGWAPDGQRIASTGYAKGRFLIVDLSDSSEVEVVLQCAPDCSMLGRQPVFSPDGNRIAFALRPGLDIAFQGLTIVEVADGSVTRVAEDAYQALTWTEDWIYYVRLGRDRGDAPEIVRVAPEGGIPQLYARLPEDCSWQDLALSLDVSTAVCSVWDFQPDVHIVENFDQTGGAR